MTDNQSSIKCQICDIKFSEQQFRSCNRRSYYRPSRIKFPGGQHTSEGFDKPDLSKFSFDFFPETIVEKTCQSKLYSQEKNPISSILVFAPGFMSV